MCVVCVTLLACFFLQYLCNVHVCVFMHACVCVWVLAYNVPAYVYHVCVCMYDDAGDAVSC